MCTAGTEKNIGIAPVTAHDLRNKAGFWIILQTEISVSCIADKISKAGHTTVTMKVEEKTMEKTEMPVGLGMALAMNPEAMEKFSSLTEKQKHEVINGTHAIASRKEMQQYVQNIIIAYCTDKTLQFDAGQHLSQQG